MTEAKVESRFSKMESELVVLQGRVKTLEVALAQVSAERSAPGGSPAPVPQRPDGTAALLQARAALEDWVEWLDSKRGEMALEQYVATVPGLAGKAAVATLAALDAIDALTDRPVEP